MPKVIRADQLTKTFGQNRGITAAARVAAYLLNGLHSSTL
jgi:hypothetical protein